MRKTNTNTAKNDALQASEVFAILRGEIPMKPIKPTRKATKEDRDRARAFLKSLSPKKCKKVDIKEVEKIEGATDFDRLVTFVLANYEGATATKKAVRFTTGVARFSCWRRVNNIRIYTNNPLEIEGVQWQEDTHEQGLTHSAYTDFTTLVRYLLEN